MKHEIIGQTVPAVEVELDKGEAMFTQSGAMAWMDPSIKGESKMEGGFLKGIGRKLAGESLFMVTYSSDKRWSKRLLLHQLFPGRSFRFSFRGPEERSVRKGFLCAQRAFLWRLFLPKSCQQEPSEERASYCRDFPETAWHFWKSTEMR